MVFVLDVMFVLRGSNHLIFISRRGQLSGKEEVGDWLCKSNVMESCPQDKTDTETQNVFNARQRVYC